MMRKKLIFLVLNLLIKINSTKFLEVASKLFLKGQDRMQFELPINEEHLNSKYDFIVIGQFFFQYK